jgi:LysM repeat protein
MIASDSISDGEMPPWLIDDEYDGWDGGQIAAGATTHEHYPIPEPGESVEDVYGSGASQKQPTMAQQGATVHTGDVHVEAPVTPIAANTPGTSQHIGIPTTEPTVKPQTAKPKQPAKPKTTGKTNQKTKKPAKRYTEPTLLTYKVRKGDNLSDIAKRSRTTVAQIKKDSGLKSDTIYPGQIIKVRFTPKGYKADKQKATPTTTSYVVKKGDMLSKVAAQHGVTTAALLKANNLTMAQAGKVRPGTKIIIPGKTSTVSKKNRR